MGKKAYPNVEYAKKITTEWQIHGGLILQSEASRMLNVSETQINNLAKQKKLYKTKLNGLAYISYSDLCNIYNERTQTAS